MSLHVGHNCNPWESCDVCGAKVEPPYSQRTDVCAMCRQGFTLCRCRHQLREWREKQAMPDMLDDIKAKWNFDVTLPMAVPWGKDDVVWLVGEVTRLRAALADIARGDYSDPLCMKTPEQRAREALAPRKDKQ